VKGVVTIKETTSNKVEIIIGQFLQGSLTMANMRKPKVCLILLRTLKIGSFICRNGIQNNGTMDELKEIR
jgi:hypothetical protein